MAQFAYQGRDGVLAILTKYGVQKVPMLEAHPLAREPRLHESPDDRRAGQAPARSAREVR